MRIAQIAPLTEAIPPKLYGGTERVISWLADELVALGHDVVLFASGDSQTSANLEACWPKALRLDAAPGNSPHVRGVVWANLHAERQHPASDRGSHARRAVPLLERACFGLWDSSERHHGGDGDDGFRRGLQRLALAD